ncbi:MAG: type II secretion system F family protein, partial [Phycisphaerales bacterium]|nr:type II secretion system F family protein [Phycisphaerales bacterium]
VSVSVFFVPMFMPIFEKLPDLPLVTKIVFGFSAALTDYGLVTLAVVGIGGFSLWRWSTRPKARRTVTRLVHRTPALGPLVRALASARFCRMMGTMLRNGVPILQAMRIAREAAGDVLLEDAIERAADAVQKGEQLAPPLAESGLFEDDIVEMIAVGEEAANLDSVLENIAETIERRVDRLLTTAVRLIEPVMLLLIAGVVAIVAMGLVLPMLQMSSAV